MKLMRGLADLRFKLLIEEIDNPVLTKKLSSMTIGNILNKDG